ncbi:MAG: hypothetical protein NC350_03895 [Corallococcus sp.]|nr:hypothetical protein [Corallococcus sp.]
MENTKQNKYRIQITNVDTGKVEIDAETNCIVGAFEDKSKDGYLGIGITSANAMPICQTILSAEKSIEELLKSHPAVMKLYTIVKALNIFTEAKA